MGKGGHLEAPGQGGGYHTAKWQPRGGQNQTAAPHPPRWSSWDRGAVDAARHDATNRAQPKKLAATLERIERRHRIRRDTLLARQVRGGYIPSYMTAWRHTGAE